MMTNLVRTCAFFITTLASMVAFGQAAAPAPAATIELVHGPVSILAADGRAREARVSEPIYAGETVVTGADAELHALTADHGFIAVRSDTRTTIKELRANGDDNDAVSIELLKGTLRLISGWIGKHNPRNYLVNTPTATIGIRGTDHEPSYFPPEERREGIESGTYEKVNSGATVLRNAAGEVFVEAGESAFAHHDASVKPAKLARVPEFYRRSANEGRIEERKGAIEPEQEASRRRRASEVKERESRDKTTSQNESGSKDSAQKEPAEKSAAEKGESAKSTESKPVERANASAEEDSSHRAPREPAKRERRRPSTH